MNDIVKGLLKGLAALIIGAVLVALAGLWRLSTHPLYITHSPLVAKYLPPEFNFKDLYLRANEYYTLPEIHVVDASYVTEEFSFRAPHLYASWNIFSLLRGNFNVSVVTIDHPQIELKLNKPSDKPFLESFKEAIALVPPKYLEIQQGNITLIDADHKEWHLENVDFYLLHLHKAINLSGNAHISGLDHPFDCKFQGSLLSKTSEYEGTFTFNNLILDDLPVADKDLKNILNYYKTPLDIEFHVHFDPKIHTKLAPSAEWSSRIQFGPVKTFPLKISGSWIDKGALNIQISKEALDIEDLQKLWPDVAIDVKKWIKKNLLAGQLSDFKLCMVLESGPESISLKTLQGKSAFRDTSLNPFPNLGIFSGLNGTISFDLNQAQVAIQKGNIEGVNLKNTAVHISYRENTPLSLALQFDSSGSLSSLGALLRKPFFKEKIPFKASAKNGNFTAKGSISFPLVDDLQFKDFYYQVQGILKEGNFTIRHKEKTSYKFLGTNLTYKTSPKHIDVQGKSQCNDLKIAFVHSHMLGDHTSSISTDIKGSGKIQSLLSFLPEIYSSQIKSLKGGNIQFSTTYKEDNAGHTYIKGNADFKNASLQIPTLQWSKEIGQPGTLDVDLTLKDHQLESFKSFNISSKGLNIRSKAAFDPKTNKLYKIIFNPFQVNGNSAQGVAQFKNNIWEVSIKAPTLRLEPLLKIFKSTESVAKNQSRDSTPISYTLNLEIPLLMMDKGYSLRFFKAFAKIRDDQLYTLHLEAQDEGKPINILYEPQKDEMVLKLTLPRLENFLIGLNITDKINAQNIRIEASKPLKNLDSSIKGKLFIDYIDIKQAPAFAKLLSLISVEGLIHALKGAGLRFNDNYAKFEYLDQKIALRRSRMMNSSIGITAVGIIDMKGKTLDLQGVLVPANFLNQIVGKIPLLGQLLTGGKDKGLFSVSYSARGKLDDPKISSNPLGLLAPNIIKNLFDGLTNGKAEKPTFRKEKPNKKKK